MRPQSPTEFPFGYDQQTVLHLTKDNDVVITHPIMPPMIFDESIMRWVEMTPDSPAYLSYGSVADE